MRRSSISNHEGMAVATQENLVSHDYDDVDSCEVATLNEIDSETCLNIGNRRTTKMAIALLDCRMQIDGRGKSECFLSRSGEVVVCPSDQLESLTMDILETILQLFDACKSSSINLYREKTFLLSAELVQLTKETSEKHSNIQEEFNKILQLTSQTNLMLKDSLLVGKELLQHTNSVRFLSINMQGILQDIQGSPPDGFPKLHQTATDVLNMDLNYIHNFNLLEGIPLSKDGSAAGQSKAFLDILEIERAYGIFCTCLFVCMLSRAWGNVTIAFLILTALNVIRAAISNADSMYFAIETVVSHMMLLVFFALCKVLQRPRTNLKTEPEASSTSICIRPS